MIVNETAITSAVETDIRPPGIGLFLVRSIKTSRSFSITWLNAFDAPTMQYPPIINIIKTDQLNGFRSSNPSKYPAIDEKSTLTAKPALVISLKSVKTDLGEMEFEVAFNVWLSETLLFGGAKVLYTSEYNKNMTYNNLKMSVFLSKSFLAVFIRS